MCLYSVSFSDESEDEFDSSPTRLSKSGSAFLCQSNDDFVVFSANTSAAILNVQFSGGILKRNDYYEFEFIEDSNEKFIIQENRDKENTKTLNIIKENGASNTLVGSVELGEQTLEIYSDSHELCATISMYGIPINEYNNAKISIEIKDIIDGFPKLLHNIEMFDNGISRTFSFGTESACISGRESTNDVFQLQCMIPIRSYLLFGIVAGIMTYYLPRKITSHRSGCFIELPLYS